ncbi:hypothetical protein [Erythrobacter ani]|uniref:Lipocalin-like domain-containing protein n=1 Tax=Erythrobacter ani TaxID=2827235 RepID=A0ABS6SHT2_9SPHN|nr:hypothetical protein [Erythrobacter ani]MBV7264583.1 hypothetical protein [Erythrobacter ani]
MNKMMTALAVMTLATSLTACGGAADTDAVVAAETASLAGTWKANLESAEFENANRNYTIADGEYACNHCLPPFSVTANGEWQTVDRPGMDSMKINIVDDNTIETASRLGDKDLGNSTWTVGDDGNSVTITWTNLDGQEVVEGTTNYNRVAAGPDGAHAASGEWEVAELTNQSDAGLVFSYEIDGDTITSTGNSFGYTATLGGEPVKPEGDESGGMIAVEKTGENTYRETYTRDGEVVDVLEMTVEGDTISAVSTDPRDDSVVRWTATRQ